MTFTISVITCTHNPRGDYLDKVLAALKSQTLPLEQWEFLLIDNASERSLASEIDLSWHPQARHVREDKLGLTPARLRGIEEAKADVLVFVDDDNVLDSDYLEVTLKISKEWPKIGAWGGQIRGEFETAPPDWAKPYLYQLCIRAFEEDKWSNILHQHETTPCGAGICVRQIVGKKYAELVNNDPIRIALDRKGKLLTSSGDTDLAFTACDLGLGTGQFTSLKLTHLIPTNRLKIEYLIRLHEGLAYSSTMLNYLRGKMPQHTSWLRVKLSEWYRSCWMNSIDSRFFKARNRGIALANQQVWNSNK
ncbi:MAG: glycosyltransferase family 2 protein [Symploca sp. SIO3E6]|nr:glycosyltransferase family 2 protein [Caldora sp. SIO3E6]